MTRFAGCFLLVFGEIAFGGMLAIAVPPFFKIERGFYKSSAAVYLAAALLQALGLGLLAVRGAVPGAPSVVALWAATALWSLFSLLLALYLLTLWTDNGRLRARAYSLTLIAGLAGVITSALTLEPGAVRVVSTLTTTLSVISSSLVLGLVSAGMLFGHWYLIDPNLPVEYLKTIVRLLGTALIANLGALAVIIALLAAFGGEDARHALGVLFQTQSALLAMRLALGPVAAIILTWMTWQTLKVPQTMAATGLLYITVMAVLVGEFLGRFIMFRTAIPL